MCRSDWFRHISYDMICVMKSELEKRGLTKPEGTDLVYRFYHLTCYDMLRNMRHPDCALDEKLSGKLVLHRCHRYSEYYNRLIQQPIKSVNLANEGESDSD